MKEFKRWESQDCSSRDCSATDCSEVACTDCEDLREVGWQAALEWVRDYMIEQESNAPYFDYVLLDKIEKELEDEN